MHTPPPKPRGLSGMAAMFEALAAGAYVEGLATCARVYGPPLAPRLDAVIDQRYNITAASPPVARRRKGRNASRTTKPQQRLGGGSVTRKPRGRGNPKFSEILESIP